MILFISITMWILCLCLVTRIVQMGLQASSPVKTEAIVWGCLILLSIPLLFRPHEDLYGGQDPGSYLNSAVSYARHQSLFYKDPLLSEVDTDARKSFLYGHEKFRLTKGACLWIKDMDKAIVGPWFQPAYPILMSLFPSMGLNFWILYVAPLFGLFTAIALAALAQQLFKHRWAGFAAFLFYVLNPNTIWHGRCPRPEMIAGFLVFGGIALLTGLVQKQSKYRLLDVILLSVALVAAPFFHITSFMAVIPIGLCIVLLTLMGNPMYLAFIPITLAGASLFVLQAQRVTDCYSILDTLNQFLNKPAILIATVITSSITITLISLFVKRKTEKRPNTPLKIHARLERYTGLCLGLSFASLLVAIYASDISHGGRVFWLPLLMHLQFTDINGVVVIHSRPLAILSLIGCVTFFVHNKQTRRYRWALGLALFPAIISIGSMPHFMYFSRRIQPFVIPAFVIALTSLITLIPQKKHRLNDILFISALVLILLFGMRNRSKLYTITENKGFTSFLHSFANEIKKNNGFLLCEYSRIAAPFDHYFGIPTLGLDSDRKRSYAVAEQQWKQIMLNSRTNQPAYFITPFQTPVSENFDFIHVMSKKLKYKKLRSFTKLPIPSGGGSQTLSLYRMQLRGQSEILQTFPYVKPFGSSTMGFKNFSKTRSKVWKISSIHCKPNATATIQLTEEMQSFRNSENLLLFFHAPTDDPAIPNVKYGDVSLSQDSEWQSLGDKWWLFQAPINNMAASEIAVTASSNIFLSDIHISSKHKILSMSQLGADAQNPTTFDCGMSARWCRADAEVLLPLPINKKTMVLIYGKTSEHGQTLTLASSDACNNAIYEEPEPEWQWFSYPITPEDASTDRTWVGMYAYPPWDPKQERWPNDIGILVGRLIVTSLEE